MIDFRKTNVEGCLIVEPVLISDDRGSFARLACVDEFTANGISDFHPVQVNMSTNQFAGTVRGLHFQVGGVGEGKLVRCLRGAIVDCVVDVRRDSSTFGEHALVELSADNRQSLWVPPYVAHGYQTLTPDTEVMYHTTDRFAPERERGLRFDDPALHIAWPLPVTRISDKDRAWPLLSETLLTSQRD